MFIEENIVEKNDIIDREKLVDSMIELFSPGIQISLRPFKEPESLGDYLQNLKVGLTELAKKHKLPYTMQNFDRLFKISEMSFSSEAVDEKTNETEAFNILDSKEVYISFDRKLAVTLDVDGMFILWLLVKYLENSIDPEEFNSLIVHFYNNNIGTVIWNPLSKDFALPNYIRITDKRKKVLERSLKLLNLFIRLNDLTDVIRKVAMRVGKQRE